MSRTPADTDWRVFISSTWRDLRTEREAVEKALHQMSGTEFNGMEYFGSRSDSPRDVCLQEVRRSNVYVGIFGGRYGYIDPESRISMTELEYREARRIGVPCLIYVKDGATPAADSETEGDGEGRQRADALKQELRREHVVSDFTTADQLATKVIIDLHNLIKERRLPTASSQPTLNELRLVLSMRFNLEELRDMCFEVGVDYDDLRGEGKSAKARELVLYMQRHRRLEKLIDGIKEARPDVGWR